MAWFLWQLHKTVPFKILMFRLSIFVLPLLLYICGCNKIVFSDVDNDESETNKEEILIAANDTAYFYLSNIEISNITLSIYPNPSKLIISSRYRLPTKLEVSTIFKKSVIPDGYWSSRQRILCYDNPADCGIKIASVQFGTGYYYTFVPYGNVTKAGFKTKYCLMPIRSELHKKQNSKMEIDIDDRWK